MKFTVKKVIGFLKICNDPKQSQVWNYGDGSGCTDAEMLTKLINKAIKDGGMRKAAQ